MIDNYLKLAENSLEANNCEEAVNYIQKVLELDFENDTAWKYKAISGLQCSGFFKFNEDEVINSFKKAIKFSSNSSIKKEIVEIILVHSDRFNKDGSDYLLNQQGFVYYTSIEPYFNSSVKTLKLLEYALDLGENSLEVGKLIIDIADDVSKKFKVNSSKGSGTEFYMLSDENQEKVNEIKKKAFSIVKKHEPDFQEKETSNKTVDLAQSNCFIITATTGSSDNMIVEKYKAFRDEKLCNNKLGRAFISVYYILGPYLAKIIRNNKKLRELTLKYFVIPVFKFIKLFN